MHFIFEFFKSFCLLFLYAYCIQALLTIFLVRRGKQKRRPLADISNPCTSSYLLVQVPLYNEAQCIAGLMPSLAGLNWAEDRICIQILDDSDDETTMLVRNWLEEHPNASTRFMHVTRNERTGFKAGALSEGLKLYNRAEYCLILDADFWPEPEFAIKLAAHLYRYPELSMVQARWIHRNEDQSWLTKLQAVAIDTHFAYEQPMRAWNGHMMNFNGTAGMWRVRCIEESGGWSFATLTEDLELSYRAQLSGKVCDYVKEVTCSSELPQTYGALRNQQFRWAKGSLQTARLFLPRLFSQGTLNFMTRLQGVMHLLHYLTQPVLGLYLLLLLYFPDRTSVLPEFFFLFLAPCILYLFSAHSLGKPLLPVVLKFPGLFMLGMSLTVPLVRAAWEALIGQPSAFVRTPKAGGSLIPVSELPVDRVWQLVEAGFWGIVVFGLVDFLRY
ncbi:MAG: glycosyltransferase [Candidatus Cloacimonetes bacterium]|nr:glycosyltransferase [Candidatus Cloacimonadota bacterium]